MHFQEQVNSVILVGRAGHHPDIKYFESGRTLATFSLAVDRPRTSPEAEPQTDWFRIELWGRQAEIAYEYVKKGSLVGIRGKLIFRSEDGVSEYFILSHALRLIGSKHDIVPPKVQENEPPF